MGGMTFEEAYQFIFKTDLQHRLKDLVAEYGNKDVYSWELQTYGWNSPAELLSLLK